MYGAWGISFLILAMCLAKCVTAPLGQNSNDKSNTRRLAIQVLRSADEFIRKNDPPKEIKLIEEKTKRKDTTNLQNNKQNNGSSKRLHDYVPALYAAKYYPGGNSRSSSSRRSKRMRRGRRRLKRGAAKINRDLLYISEYPTSRRIYRGVNKLGFCLRIHMNGKVDGTKDVNDGRSLLSFESHGPSIFRIKGVVSNRYLVIGPSGLPRAEENPKLFNSLFRLTHEENSWDTVASYKYYFEKKYDMLIGITKDSLVKKPWKAAPGQHATQFLLIPP